MIVCGQEFTDIMIQKIQEKVNQEPELSRGVISRGVCEWLYWKSPHGKMKEMSCRVALLRLERRGKLTLPSPKSRPFPQRNPPPSPSLDADWVKGEFQGASCGDERLNKRLLTIVRDFYACPEGNIPQACGSKAKTKACYRFFDHPEIAMNTLLSPHYEATRKRVAQEPLVLALQDTTFQLSGAWHQVIKLVLMDVSRKFTAGGKEMLANQEKQGGVQIELDIAGPGKTESNGGKAKLFIEFLVDDIAIPGEFSCGEDSVIW